ncbi:MAG: glycosyltransferase family 4 protein [Planctomycetota bacterium]|nr:glycosyltransferase family 4 protein [Planctomycetota bacterium]
MKIGHFVSVVAGQRGFERNVSGHIQVPLHAMNLLQEAGHEVHLITNEFDEARTLPSCLPKNINTHFVVDARNRDGVLERTSGEGSGISPLKLMRQVKQIKRICREENLDVLHLYGYNRTAHLAGGLRLMGLPIPVVVTMFATFFPESLATITRRLWNRVDAVVTATLCTKQKLENEHISSTQIKHGVVRDLVSELGNTPVQSRSRVLFWRDLTVENGADVTLSAYEKLAKKHPNIQFELAVREHWNELAGADEMVQKHPNVTIRRFPYQDGVTLPQLLLESICVVMPIRDISIDPQLVILETLAAGVPIITTNHRSNPEIVQDGVTGLLVPLGDVKATTEAIDQLLLDQRRAIKMGKQAKKDIADRWNWNGYVKEIEQVYKRVIG